MNKSSLWSIAGKLGTHFLWTRKSKKTGKSIWNVTINSSPPAEQEGYTHMDVLRVNDGELLPESDMIS